MKDFQNIIAEAAEILRRPGAVILVPTETVYGLVCRAADEAACRRIFELKQRPFSKVLGWFVSGIPMLEQCNVVVNDCAADLISRYTPGALTLISETTDGGTQGYRIPDHPLLSGIVDKLGEPLAQTSANASGLPDARSCQEALAQLAGSVDFFVDGGTIPEEIKASTVVDTTVCPAKILRQGCIILEI